MNLRNRPTVHIDFETYSEAGFELSADKKSWHALKNASKKGLPAIGLAAYATHPSTEILCMAWSFSNEDTVHTWVPTAPFPELLKEHVLSNGTITAWNSAFERWVWQHVGVTKYDFPPISISQFLCTQSRARAFCLPPSLAEAGEVLNIQNKKDKEGKRLISKFSMPRNATKKDERLRIQFKDDPNDAVNMISYNMSDVIAEKEIDKKIPHLLPQELEFWKIDQIINTRGIKLDLPSILNAIEIIEQAYRKYNTRLKDLTKGSVESASEVQKLKSWLSSKGIHTGSLDAEHLAQLLSLPPPPDVYEALKIRDLIGAAAVKKLYAMKNQIAPDGRLHELFIYHAARTGRAAGVGVQPQNLPNSGLSIYVCEQCHKSYNRDDFCPWCYVSHPPNAKKEEWRPQTTIDALEIVKTKSLSTLEFFYKDAIGAISSCVRGLFISEKNHDFICSDYSAIEAVVLAALSEEEWRLEVFRTHGMIYEMSASKLTGKSLESYVDYKKTNGKHHPDRTLGKISELSSGYGGGLGAWKRFGADSFFSEDEIRQAILKWRQASPQIVNFWYGLERAAKNAINNPGHPFNHNSIVYLVNNNVLLCVLPSKRCLTYHNPRLIDDRITFEGYNSNETYGARGWLRMETYGGKLTENVVQAVARDILIHAIVNLEKNNYPVVLHVHDEIVAEVPENFGSVEQFENIMSTLPSWASTWPLRAKGGWRAKRYTK